MRLEPSERRTQNAERTERVARSPAFLYGGAVGSLTIQTGTVSLPGSEEPKTGIRSSPGNLGGRTVEIAEPVRLPDPQPELQQLAQPVEHDVQLEQPPDNPLMQGARRLMTRDELVAVAGSPRKDVKFLGITWWRHSTGYKTLLNKLDQYHERLSAPVDSKQSPQQTMARLKSQVQGLVSECDVYLGKESHTRGQQVAELKNTAIEELKLLQQLEVGPPKIQDWPKDAQIGTVAKLVRELGIPQQDAVEMSRFFSFEEAKSMMDGGLTPAEVIGFGSRGFSARAVASVRRGGINSQTAFELSDFGIAPDHVSQFPASGLTRDQALPFSKIGIAPRDAKKILDAGGDLESAKAYLKLGLRSSEVGVCFKHEIPLDVAKMYRARRIPISDANAIGRFREHLQSDPPKQLGSGAFNTVFEVGYDDLLGKSVRVFKEETNSPVTVGWVAEMTGVSKSSPQFANRNIATKRMGDLLGFDVVPDSQFATMRDRNGEVRLGFVMEFAPGRLGTDCGRTETKDVTNGPIGKEILRLQKSGAWGPGVEDALKRRYRLSDIQVDGGKVSVTFQGEKLFDHPSVRQEMVKLQLLDGLCGQGDRHSSNYLVQYNGNTGRAKVTGIDNDQSFGSKALDPNDLAFGHDEGHIGFRGVKLPPVIDTEMAQSIESITPQQLRENLSGLLSPSEIRAAESRLTKLKEHVQTLRNTNRIIAPNEWGDPQVGVLLSDSKTSYVGRDLQRLSNGVSDFIF